MIQPGLYKETEIIGSKVRFISSPAFSVFEEFDNEKLYFIKKIVYEINGPSQIDGRVILEGLGEKTYSFDDLCIEELNWCTVSPDSRPLAGRNGSEPRLLRADISYVQPGRYRERDLLGAKVRIVSSAHHDLFLTDRTRTVYIKEINYHVTLDGKIKLGVFIEDMDNRRFLLKDLRIIELPVLPASLHFMIENYKLYGEGDPEEILHYSVEDGCFMVDKSPEEALRYKIENGNLYYYE